MSKKLLQFKFFLVAFLNFTTNIIPYPLRNVYLKVWGITLPLSSSIHRGIRFFHIGNISIGKNSVVNFCCFLDNRRKIIIGNNVCIGHCSKIYTLGHDLDDPEFKTKGKEVRIDDNAFLFSNVLVMPGVIVGEGAIVLAGSVVTKNIAPYTIVGGNPAKVIKQRKKSIKYLTNYNYYWAL